MYKVYCLSENIFVFPFKYLQGYRTYAWGKIYLCFQSNICRAIERMPGVKTTWSQSAKHTRLGSTLASLSLIVLTLCWWAVSLGSYHHHSPSYDKEICNHHVKVDNQRAIWETLTSNDYGQNGDSWPFVDLLMWPSDYDCHHDPPLSHYWSSWPFL